MNLLVRFRDHKNGLIEAAEESPFIVFLSGPTLDDKAPEPLVLLNVRDSFATSTRARGHGRVMGNNPPGLDAVAER